MSTRRRLIAASAAATALVTGALFPAKAVPVPVIASDNVSVLATLPDVGAIATAFASDKPVMYVNTLAGVSSFDISDPKLPKPLGHLTMPHFENEAMSVGERADGTKFVIVGIDVFAISPTDSANLVKPTPGTGRKHMIIVDVTDPANMRIRGRTDTTTSTHTVQCVGKACTYAYTSGAYDGGRFDVVDLTNLDAPKVVKTPQKLVSGVAGGPANIGNHQWDADEAGIMWGTGGAGAVGVDVTDPLNPKQVASTDASGSKAPYNDFALHNSYRPGAKNFVQTRDEATGRLVSGSKETASPFDGNVLLVTEEDYDNPDCQAVAETDAPEGGFSTWYIPYMDEAQYKLDNPSLLKDKGKITPLDIWNTELAFAPGVKTPAGALCSAHYFTYHDKGFVAQGWYQQGTRILDVRNPRDIKQVGYFFGAVSEAWHSYWVPEYDAAGKQTGKDTNIIYTNDVVRGIDVLQVTLPTTPPEATAPLTAPILQSWLDGSAALGASKPSPVFGYSCRLAGSAGL